MRYLILIYVDPATYASVSEAEQQAEMAEYYALGPTFRERGWDVSGEALQPVDTATTVRQRDGKFLVTDGPFAETKEHLGGFYLVDCANLDEALEFARSVPDVRRGSIEVRPVLEFS
ncbi:MAG: YciI family protein [Anaerolineae bacterium]|uniref:YciI family protein n=1 Tax=Promineifilum sp. TaxID=2664178 RepID=UPI001D4B4EE9|nr:YciI family protein [Anaerolineales bacterium]MCB8933851.1 YciI family protein [Promineifilum sp.]MCO5181396.1 YciI family protein [Promineifilum sp.]MCW5846324.1 YciI family protein [Anaerolineae bacterium]